MLYLSLENTEWPWVALVCMQMVVLMPDEIAPHQNICRNSPALPYIVHKILAIILT